MMAAVCYLYFLFCPQKPCEKSAGIVPLSHLTCTLPPLFAQAGIQNRHRCYNPQI